MAILPGKLRELRYRAFYGLLLRRGYELVTLGDQSHGLQWTICPNGLNSRSVVYSCGLGSDISFEHELVRRFGGQVVMLDPSPTGMKTMELPENKIPQFHYFPLALARHSGKLLLAPPSDPTGDSWSAKDGARATLEVSATDLGSLMAKNGHQAIDLLKLDIEANEYEVIEDILDRRLAIHQICVEYHHGIVPGIRRSQTIASMLKLIARGYRLLHQDGANHTFLLSRWPPTR